MNMMKRTARLGFVAALFALLLGPLAFSAQSAFAQAPPAGFYSTGNAGSAITASIDGEACDATAETSDEGWSLQIAQGDCGGNAGPGATVHFYIDGEAAAETAEWTSGFTEVTLTVAPPEPDDGMDDGMDDTMDDGMDDGMDDTMDDGMDDTMTPGDKGDTGNAGFVTESGSASTLLVLALGVLALAGVAGARTVTGRVS
jgi:hypothetical protein